MLSYHHLQHIVSQDWFMTAAKASTLTTTAVLPMTCKTIKACHLRDVQAMHVPPRSPLPPPTLHFKPVSRGCGAIGLTRASHPCLRAYACFLFLFYFYSSACSTYDSRQYSNSAKEQCKGWCKCGLLRAVLSCLRLLLPCRAQQCTSGWHILMDAT